MQYIDERYFLSLIVKRDFTSEITVQRRAFVREVDDLVASGMDRSIDALITQVDDILREGHCDFNPQPELFKMDVQPSDACVEALKLIDDHIKVLAGVADRHTLDIFHSEIAIRAFK